MKALIRKLTIYTLLPFATSSLFSTQLNQGLYQHKQLYNEVAGKKRIKKLIPGYCRESSRHYLAKEILQTIIRFALPKNLSGEDLTHLDLRGCKFADTNVINANLSHTILRNTICDYQQAFLDNMKDQNRTGKWYEKNIPQDLKSIQEVYCQIKSDARKARLLHIACGFSRLPFYGDKQLLIKLQYWSCKWLLLKQKLEKVGDSKLTCSLEKYLNFELKYYCWTRSDSKKSSSISNCKLSKKELCSCSSITFPKNADYWYEYIEKQLDQGNKNSKLSHGRTFYMNQISSMLEGLQEAYQAIKQKNNSQKFKEEICFLFNELVYIERKEGIEFLAHYLFLQNRLISLKEMTGLDCIYYSPKKGHLNLGKFKWQKLKRENENK